MVVAAPKTPVTGFQTVEVRKSTTPNFPIASDDSRSRTVIIPMIKMMTVEDASAVREKKNSSGKFRLGDIATEPAFLRRGADGELRMRSCTYEYIKSVKTYGSSFPSASIGNPVTSVSHALV